MNTLVGFGKDGEGLITFILEPGNLHALQMGRPISVRTEEYFPNGIPTKLELVVMFSATPIADSKQLKTMVAPDGYFFDERSVQKRQPHCPECQSTIEQLGVWRNESPMAIVFCSVCGCVFGMVPQEVAAMLPPVKEGAK